LSAAYQQYGSDFPLQGNLDPSVLFASNDVLDRAAFDLLAVARGNPYIFSLGHGLMPETPVESIRHLVQIVHEASSSSSGAGSPRGGERGRHG